MTSGTRNRLGYKRAQVRYRILEALDEREYNPTKVASEIGCTLSNVSRVLNGKGHSPSVLSKLRAIGVNDAHNAMSRLYRTEIKPEQKRIEHIRDGFIRRFQKQLGKRVAAIGGVTTPENMRGIGRSNWTAEHIWCIARNMGNEGNLKTLTEGFGLDMDSLRALTSVLTADEWQAIQSEGNLLGRFYEETDAVFRKVYGRPMPDKVQPTELTVNTADGQALTLPGWYYPLSVDGRLDPDIADKQQIDILQADPNVTAFGPSLKRAHTKARSGTSKPVNLAFDVFERSMEDQLRFMTHAPVLRDFDRMTRNKEWRKAYTAAFGEQAYGEIRPMLKYLARPQSEMNGSMDGFLARQRQLASLFILGHNVKTFVRQFQGVMQAVPDLGMGPILRGMGRVYRSPRGAVAAINELSPFMADRDLGFNRELREATRAFKAAVKVRIGDKTYTEAHVHEFTMSLVRIGDQLAVYPIWQGAFMKAQNELGMSQKDAVVFADRIIQKSNASATPVDLTPLQREGGAWRLFTMFMGEPMRKGSRMRYWWNAMHAGKIGVGEYTGHLMMETVVPALFFVGLVGFLSDDEPDWQDVSIATLGELTGSIPLLSQLSGALQYNKPLTQSSVFTGVEAAMKLGKATYSVWDDPDNQEAWSRFFKSSVDLTAYTAGVGNVRRVYETAAEGWEALQFGQTHNPFRVFFRQPRDAK